MEAVCERGRAQPPVAHGLRMHRGPAPVGDLGEAFGIGFAFGEIAQARLLEITGVMRREVHRRGGHLAASRACFSGCRNKRKPRSRTLPSAFGGIADPDDIRLRLHGCPAPRPAWGNGRGQARCRGCFARARRERFQGHVIHISGCEKLCAFPHEAAISCHGARAATP